MRCNSAKETGRSAVVGGFDGECGRRFAGGDKDGQVRAAQADAVHLSGQQALRPARLVEREPDTR
jgi:hypothetical protein